MQMRKDHTHIVGYAIYYIDKNNEVVIDDNEFNRGFLLGFRSKEALDKHLQAIGENDNRKYFVGKFKCSYSLVPTEEKPKCLKKLKS